MSQTEVDLVPDIVRWKTRTPRAQQNMPAASGLHFVII